MSHIRDIRDIHGEISKVTCAQGRRPMSDVFMERRASASGCQDETRPVQVCI